LIKLRQREGSNRLEDHVQEVFLRAWRSRDRFEGGSSPRTWLYRIATNACLDTLRRDARQTAFFPFVLTVLRFEHGRVVDIAAFEQPSMFPAFGLPASL
jgi:DNA-directed RNA polymerase specialized sigma24 family protein